MRSKREDFFPSELYWLDRIGPVSVLTQLHGGVPTDVTDLVTIDPNGAPLCVAFDRLIEPDWKIALNHMLGVGHLYQRVRVIDPQERFLVDARVTTNWPTSEGMAWWKGHDAPYMILNLYEVLMHLALCGAGRIRMYSYPHPRPVNKKFIPMPWTDVSVASFLVEKGETPSLETDTYMRFPDWP